MISLGANRPAPSAAQPSRAPADTAVATPAAPAGPAADAARPPAASWTFSDSQVARSGAIQAVTGALQRAQSVLDATLAAGPALTDLLSQARSSAALGAEPALDPAARQANAERYDGLLRRLDGAVRSARFDGASLIDPSAAGYQPLHASASADGAIAISVAAEDLAPVSGLGLTPGGAATPTAAAAEGDRLDQAVERLRAAMARFGDAAKAVENQLAAVTKLQASLPNGVADQADAVMAKDSVNLQALQLRQQLADRGLSIANGAPQAILSLFKGQSGG